MLFPVGQLAVSAGIWMSPKCGYHSHSLPIVIFLLQLLSTRAFWRNAFKLQEVRCPGPQWNAMCRSCCEYVHIVCKCPSQGRKVGYTVPCCRNVLDECDPCILHQGCNIFDNCKTCNNGSLEANDDFYIRGMYCASCRQGWSGGDCLTCGDVIKSSYGHVTIDSYPINARCEWTLQVQQRAIIELRFSMLSLESDHSCRYDYVEVRDGDSIKSPVIGRYCGDKIPSPIRGSGNTLHLHFVSDGYNNYDGFFVTFHEVSGRAPAHCATPKKPANGDVSLLFKEGTVLRAVQYRCQKPYKLKGSSQRVCLPNGSWSGNAPLCMKEQHCTPRQLHNGYSVEVSDADGNVKLVEYYCNSTYVLSGDSKRTCQKNGSWSGSQPMCVRACKEPKVSKLVRQKVLKKQLSFRQGGTEKHLLEKNSRVFGDLPPTFHHLYTTVEYDCHSPLYKYSGSARRTCLKTGKWSGRHFSCSPVCGRLPPASLKNVSNIHWPWHAALYTRVYNTNPFSGRTKRRGDTFVVDEDDEEEGWIKKDPRWQRACSGALVSQRWVVVSAHCVTEPGRSDAISADDLNVVMGRHHHEDLREKRLQHMQVAQILIHPNYEPYVLNSDLAMVQLADKARISEDVSPVCLPFGEVTARQAFLTSWPRANTDAARTGLLELADVQKCERQYGKHGVLMAMNDQVMCGRQHPLSPSTICPSETGGIVVVPSTDLQLTLLDGDSHRSWELLGLVSHRYDWQACNPDLYSIYTRVANFKNWIEKHIP